jgi:hypothetical protein
VEEEEEAEVHTEERDLEKDRGDAGIEDLTVMFVRYVWCERLLMVPPGVGGCRDTTM